MNRERQGGLATVLRIRVRAAVHEPAHPMEPLAVDAAIARVERWLARPHLSVLVPGSNHLATAFRLLTTLGAGGSLTTDAQIAAHAVDHGGEIFSNDSDFARFDGVRVVNPLGSPPPMPTAFYYETGSDPHLPKEIWRAVDLIEDDELLGVLLEKKLRSLQLGKVLGRFEIEIG